MNSMPIKNNGGHDYISNWFLDSLSIIGAIVS